MNKKELIEELATEALKLARARGHKVRPLSKWKKWQTGEDHSWRTTCSACHLNVFADTGKEKGIDGMALDWDCDPDKLPF